MTAEAPLPKSIAANPDVSTWLTFSDGFVLLRSGKVELGQGILTALVQIVAVELSVSADRIKPQAARTDLSPDEGFTAGSMSIAESGSAFRYLCRQLRRRLVRDAATVSGCVDADVTIDDGTAYVGARPVASYWREIPTAPYAGTMLRPSTTIGRIDLPDKVFGRPRFIHDMRFDMMVHARVVHPPARVAKLTSLPVDTASIPGLILMVQEGMFVAVVAEREEQAVAAADSLAAVAQWQCSPSLPAHDDLSSWLRSQPCQRTDVTVTVPPPEHREGFTMTADYHKGFTAHASLAPSCAIAHYDSDTAQLQVWTHSQGIFALRNALAEALALDATSIVVTHVEGAGCYGHNPADDVACEAAILAIRLPGRHVRLQWSRADELRWAAFGPAMTSTVTATVGANGRITDWSYDLWSNGHSSRPGYAGGANFLPTAHSAGISVLPSAEDPAPARGHGSGRNAAPNYVIPRVRATAHRILKMPIRTSAVRSLGAYHNVFTIESFIDELALAAAVDPLEFRLAHLTDRRAIDVLTDVADAAHWHAPLPAHVSGRGIAQARYKGTGAWCAAVVHVVADHRIRISDIWLAVDVGHVISSDGVRNQIEGGAIQATSWTLLEEVTFDEYTVTSADWESYPIIRFPDVPDIHVNIRDRPDMPPVGAGEAAQGPVAAAIGNAVADALGKRVRTIPMTHRRVVAALA